MFALSRDGERIFLYHPDGGMMVPVFLDLKNREMTVKMPDVAELEHDYAVYGGIDEIAKAVGDEHRDEVEFAAEFSRTFSRIFHERISHGKVTIASLRKLVVAAIQKDAKAEARAKRRRTGKATLREAEPSIVTGERHSAFKENLFKFIDPNRFGNFQSSPQQHGTGPVPGGNSAKAQSLFLLDR